jgi:undecaprenyl-diphosphatase
VHLTGPPLLPPALRRWAAALAALCAGVLAVLAVRYRGSSGAGHLDRWVRARVAGPTGVHGTAVDVLVSAGNPPWVATAAAASALGCVLLRRWRAAVLAVAAPAATGAVTTLLKALVGRTLDGDLALPSGHTGGVTSVSLVLALLLVDLVGTPLPAPVAAMVVLLPVLAVPGVVALALVATGSHYATDTVAGFCTAVAVTLALGLVLDGPAAGRAPASQSGSRS